MANEKNLVKYSLHKFLSDNLTTFVTYDSNQSELKSVAENLTIDPNGSDLIAGTTVFQVYQGGILYNADAIDLIGHTISVNNATFDSDTIVAWDNLTSTVTINTGFANDVSVFDTMNIGTGGDSLIYMTRPYDIASDGGNQYFSEEIDRYDLIIKVKDDSTKDKIDSILQNIRNLIRSSYNKFVIYDSDLITKLGFGRIYSYKNEGEIDVNNDIQSYLSTFQVEYRINYFK